MNLFQREKAITKHLSSSTEDLILLFKAEKNIVKFLKSEPTKDSTKEIIESYLKSVDFDEKTETEEYVFHPVNAYHLLKRTTKWIPKLTKVIPNLDFEFHLPQGIMVHCKPCNPVHIAGKLFLKQTAHSLFYPVQECSVVL
jgi:hypothetical protein